MRALLFLLLIAPAAWSCESINLGMRSYHWDREAVSRGLIEEHFAVGCTDMVDRWDWLYFRNSKNRGTLFVGDEWRWKTWGSVSLNFDYGLFFHGYSKELPFIPAVLPKFTWSKRHVRLNVYVLYNQGVAAGLEFPL